jgi:hypothetical protein
MSEVPGSFGKSVLECAQDLERHLPALTGRHRRIVVVRAMAEHVGQALRTLLRRQICDISAARRLLGRIESQALRREAALKTSPQDAGSASPGHRARQ